MYTFILIVDSPKEIERAGSFLGQLGAVQYESSGRSMVEAPSGAADGWIAIIPGNDVVSDYEPEDLAKIKQKVKHPQFFVVEGRDTTTSFANDFVLSIRDDLIAWVDNDHGYIEEITRLKARILSGFDWLYFSPERD
jgi:hypothetical protein